MITEQHHGMGGQRPCFPTKTLAQQQHVVQKNLYEHFRNQLRNNSNPDKQSKEQFTATGKKSFSFNLHSLSLKRAQFSVLRRKSTKIRLLPWEGKGRMEHRSDVPDFVGTALGTRFLPCLTQCIDGAPASSGVLGQCWEKEELTHLLQLQRICSIPQTEPAQLGAIRRKQPAHDLSLQREREECNGTQCSGFCGGCSKDQFLSCLPWSTDGTGMLQMLGGH